MPTTDTHSLPYPAPSDPADVPADIAALAEAVDGKLDDIAPGQITGATSGQVFIADSSGVVTARTVTGDVTVSNTGVTAIGSGAVGTNNLANSAVTTVKIDNGSVTTAKLAAPTTQTASPTGAGLSGTITFRKYADGLVQLSGAISGTPTIGTDFIFAPDGYRPTEAKFFVVSQQPGTVTVRVKPSGQNAGGISIQTAPTTNTPIDLSGVSYHAA